jgi:transposase
MDISLRFSYVFDPTPMGIFYLKCDGAGSGRTPLLPQPSDQNTGALRTIGADATETLDYVPGRFKVIRHVREAFSCRACETVVQAPAPYHPICRGRAGAGLLGSASTLQDR